MYRIYTYLLNMEDTARSWLAKLIIRTENRVQRVCLIISKAKLTIS